MPVHQVLEALGSFDIELLGNVPREVLDNIDHFDHIAVIPGRMDPEQYGDNTLDVARYVGVVRKKRIADDGRTNLVEDDITISGVSMEFWLGDDDGKGAILESPVEFTNQGFTTVITDLLPDTVSNGTIYSVTGGYSGRHVYQTPRDAIKYVCDTLSTTDIPVGYRVNNDCSVDAGPESDLFVTNPTCIIMRKGSTQGEDMFMRALPSTVDMDIDMEDFATRVVMLAEADGDQLATGSADIASLAPGVNVYKDLFGNPLALTKLVSESDTLETNADTRAALALQDVIYPHRTLTVSTQDFDVYGSFEIGDYIYVYDPDSGLVDTSNEVYVRGVRINPMKLRVTESEFPVTSDYTVAHRSKDGTWTDITDYIHFEEVQPTQVTIGDFARDLTSTSNPAADRTGAVTPPNFSVPSAPAWVTASFQTTNYSDGVGNPKARQKLVWAQPLNTDGSTVTDGDHYELRYRLNAGSQYSQTWAAASTLTWDQMSTWDQPVNPDETVWQVLVLPWGDTSTVIHELPVGTAFESQIRAVDRGGNQGDWSLLSIWITSEDNIPPSQPAAPVVAGNPVSIQVVHELGRASGGTFNLENDLAFLEVHYSADNGFFPTTDTLVGHMKADQGMINAHTPAVGTFTIPETDDVFVKVVAVDMGGNRSNASEPSPVTAELIDSQHISELTASKITAGTLGADIILGASIKTAPEGQRVELNMQGLQAFNADGDPTINLSSNASGGDYLTLQDVDGNTVVSISEEGDGAFTNVYANNDLFVAGQDFLNEILPSLPRGVIAITDLSGNSPAYNGTMVPMGSVSIPAYDLTRQYAVGMGSVRMDRQAQTFIDRITIESYYAWDRPPTTSDPSLFTYQTIVGVGDATGETYTGDQNISIRYPFNLTSLGGSDLYVGFWFHCEESSATGLRVQGGDGGLIYAEDVGPVVDRGVYDLTGGTTGGGGGGGGAIQTFTKSYSSTWTRSYQGDGSLRISNGDMYQGYYSSTNGNQRSLIGFDDDKIRSDLSGATIKKVELTLDNVHFYNNSGGTAVIGTHDYGSSPSTWSGSRVDESRQNFSWAKGAKKTVTLSNSFGTDFKSGNATGIALGPGDSTSLTYYSYFSGQNSSNKPVLKITYTK